MTIHRYPAGGEPRDTGLYRPPVPVPDPAPVTPAPRLQLNPRPLRTVPRRELATIGELTDDVRCRAKTRAGNQCKRLQLPEGHYCRQHSLTERRCPECGAVWKLPVGLVDDCPQCKGWCG